MFLRVRVITKAGMERSAMTVLLKLRKGHATTVVDGSQSGQPGIVRGKARTVADQKVDDARMSTAEKFARLQNILIVPWRSSFSRGRRIRLVSPRLRKIISKLRKMRIDSFERVV